MSKTPFEFFGTETIPVAAHPVWLTLQNPKLLSNLIPGIERIEQTGPTSYAFEARLKLGIIKPVLSGTVSYTDVLPDHQVGMKVEQFSKAGSSTLDVLIRLESCSPDETEVNYRVSGLADGLLAKAGVKALEKLSETAIRKFIDSLDDLIRQQQTA
ncbi:MAG TPA: SRPBCC domain-containing protein [Saprospiraceae bacterium]|nr:SRPBCC domain-containing protein [Saprospiraceae bacterium]